MGKNNFRKQHGKFNSKKYSTRDRSKKNYRESTIEDSYAEINRKIKPIGLVIFDVEGDGNCLFRSLSDQMFGTDEHHAKLRKETCEYIEEHGDHFKNFFSDESGQTFEVHLREMKGLGTFGDNFELVAFANKYNVDIHIYQDAENVLTIQGTTLETKTPDDVSEKNMSDNDVAEEEKQADATAEKNESSSIVGEDTKTADGTVPKEAKSAGTPPKKGLLHLAYHSWEHYSSIRNIKGPFNGLPNIDVDRNIKEMDGKDCTPSDIDLEEHSSSEGEYQPKKKPTGKKLRANVAKVVKRTSCQDKERILRLLRENGNIPNKVVQIIKSEEKDSQEAAKRPASQSSVQEEPSDPSLNPKEASPLSTDGGLVIAPCQDRQDIINSICEVSPRTPPQSSTPSRKSPRRDESRDSASPKKSRGDRLDKPASGKAPQSPASLNYIAI